MRYFYSSGAYGYGEGYKWHRRYDFPYLPFVTKTLTLCPIDRWIRKYAILPIGNSVLNKVSLHNIGVYNWIKEYYPLEPNHVTVSLAGTDDEIGTMIEILEHRTPYDIGGVEYNFSCPNVKSYSNKKVPYYDRVHLKLNYKQDPYDYDLNNVTSIRLNSIPILGFCGGSGKVAQKKNWAFIEKFNKEGLNIAGCSFTCIDDIKRLEDLGCTEIGIGSIMLTNPRLVEGLKNGN